MTAAVGTPLGRYQIRSQIGAGGMGEVYLAQDTQLDRTVALKILPAPLASDEQRMRRFVQEAKAASALNHPNIITIYEVGNVDSVHFISTEFVDGATLRELMTGAHLTLRETFDMMVQVASALSAAHAAGIVHRDIKPENIMLRRDGYVKVLDFGLAKLTEKVTGQVSDPEANTMPFVKTDPGIVMGTLNYMSPEQARGLAVDERSDIWSFGVVFYEMLTGHMPFDGTTPRDVIVAILNREPPTLVSYSPKAPAELDRIVSKALAKDPEERYQTVKDLLIDIRRLKQRLEIEAELERAIGPDLSGETREALNDEQPSDAAARDRTLRAKKLAAGRTATSAQYLISESKRHILGAVITLAILGVVAITIVYVLRSQAAIDSIAVVPFFTADNDPLVQELSDGITESIINDLPQLASLRVVPRATMLHYKGQSVDPQKAGTDLGVRAVLTGRVSKRGDTIIVRTELIDMKNQSQIWGEAFTTTLPDIIGGATPLTLQEEMSKRIFEKLQIKLRGSSKTAAQNSP